MNPIELSFSLFKREMQALGPAYFGRGFPEEILPGVYESVCSAQNLAAWIKKAGYT